MTISCPKCEAKTKVYARLHMNRNRCKRYRKCLKCDFHFLSIEKVLEREDLKGLYPKK